MRKTFITYAFIVLFAIAFVAPAYSQDAPDFRKIVEGKILKEHKGRKLSDLCPVDTNKTARRIFLEYGAMYLAENGIKLSNCIFPNEEQVTLFQSSIETRTETIDGTSVTLQRAAMEALLRARQKAASQKLKISPRSGSTAAKRSYDDTRRFWDSRFFPGLAHWVKKGKLKQSDADAARLLPTEKQVEQVLAWEDQSLFFSKDLSKSILYSVAAPGASQHISMIAFDVSQFSDKRVRAILAEEGWFQTVKSDAPHFTYLGLKESDLPSRGLKLVTVGSQDFWIPDFE